MKPDQSRSADIGGRSAGVCPILGPSRLPCQHGACLVGSPTQALIPRVLPRDLCEACGLLGGGKMPEDDRQAPVDTGGRG